MAPRTRSTAKNPSNPKTPAADAAAGITVQRTAKCRTLGNGSQLTYEIGADTDGQPHVRMTAAAGGGFFSREWLSLAAILAALDAWPTDRPLTSNALAPLFRGKSANNASFLAAVLVAEGVLQRMPERKRHLERCDPTDASKGFDGFGGTAPAPKRSRGSKASRTSTDKGDKTISAAKAGASHTAETDKTPALKARKAKKKLTVCDAGAVSSIIDRLVSPSVPA